MSTRGIQYIIDNASAIEFGRAKTVGQLVTRSGRLRAAERASTNPWQLVVTPPTYARYEDVRDVIEGVNVIDRGTYFWIDFNQNAGLNYVTAYKGDMTPTQLTTLRVSTLTNYLGAQSFNINEITGNQGDNAGYTSTATFNYMSLTNLPSLGSTGTNGVITTSSVMFKAGDWIQFSTSFSLGVHQLNRGFPRTVPLDVLRGSTSTVTVPVSRPFIWQGSNSNSFNDRGGAKVDVGNSVRIGMILTKMPSWKLLPGKIVQWSGDFEMYEYQPGNAGASVITG
jgi:hypothetical protein